MDEQNNRFCSVLERQLKLAHVLAFKMKQASEAVSREETKLRFTSCYPLIHMAGIAALNLTRLTKQDLMSARDAYGIARSCVELSINFAYLLVSENDVLIKIEEHAMFRHLSGLDRARDVGGWYIRATHCGKLSEAAESKLDQLKAKFLTKKGRIKGWSEDSIYKKIDKIAAVLGRQKTIELSSAVDLIYEISSEYIHGSLFSAFHFIGTREDGSFPSSSRDFSASLESRIQESLIAAILGLQGAFECFSEYARDRWMKEEVEDIRREISSIVVHSENSPWTVEMR